MRNESRIAASTLDHIRRAAAERCIDASAVLLTATADAVRLWARHCAFGLVVTEPGATAGREVRCDLLDGTSFADRARHTSEQLAGVVDQADAVLPLAGSGLSWRLALDDAGLTVVWEAPKGLLSPGVGDELASVYRQLLERLADDTALWDRAGRIAELPAWQLAERAAANDTAADLPVATLCGLVEERAARCPDAPAVIAHDGTRLTYREVVSDARRLARRLTALGAQPGQLVGVVTDKGCAQVPAALGVTLARAAYLPIDPQWPAARRAQLIDQGLVQTVVTTPRLRDELDWPEGVRLVTLEDAEVRAEDDGALAVLPGPDDLAYVIFTSGSTGQPKGVVIDHRGAANTVQDINERFGVGPADRILALSSLSFDLSVYDVFGALAAGAAVVMPAPGRSHDPEHWSDLVQKYDVSVWNSVPALLRVWLESPVPVPASAPLRLVMLSGDWIPVTLPDALRAVFPAARVISLGGATEASIWSIHYPVGTVPAEWSRIPYGKPLANQTMHVLDDRLDPCPVWAIGEIWIGGVGVAKGYWADEDRTRASFVVHPVTGERLYRTGDVGRYLPGGDIEFLGREDTQVKVNGYRIELDEIAAVLRRRPSVHEALVTVATNPVTDRGQIVAYVVPEQPSGEPLTAGRSVPGFDADHAWTAALEAADRERTQATGELAPAIETFRDMWHRLAELAPTVMARNLARLGVFGTRGATVTADSIVERCGVRPVYRGLIDQWMTVLTQQGVLERTGHPAEFRCAEALDAEALDARIDADLTALEPAHADRQLATYFTECIHRQLDLLTGAVRPLQLLLPDGDWRVTKALYADNPAARLQNRIAAQAVRRFVDAFTGERKVRVVELGAGTGATADQVLPSLPADRVEYLFTDLSTAFTESARGRYDTVHPFVSYGLYDIDGDPTGQGLTPGTFDVVVAANVLHDAKNLGRALKHVRSLLTPGGLLVLIEGTVNSPLNMISFAFLEGFGNYQDQRSATLLSVPEWRAELDAAGFRRSASVPDGAPAVDALAQHVIVAGAPDGGVLLETAGLGDSLGELLPEYMVPHHFISLDELPLSANGKVDRAALPLPWRETLPQDRTAPRTDLERRLHAIWSDALGTDDFGVDDNFFDLGGDSLHAVRIVGTFRTELGLQTAGDEAIDMFFDAPTIAELAQVLAGRAGDHA
ncbi:amino acid adenylation domain-containing protein [Streptomyces coelicoflavus]|uniref:Amino acid adenylation domain-containing protein n=1 Tax=Streptomyces coelicoflavus TaxID=285562 RepID=A0A7K3PYB2_9ACTN|nr:amino acid adenylation domain-containing protein [Streptomyces coelicoflavus]